MLTMLLVAALGCASSTVSEQDTDLPQAPGEPGGGGHGGGPVPPPEATVPIPCDEGFDFEDECGAIEFSDFGGGQAEVIDNPDPTGPNTTPKVVRMRKLSGEVFGGSTFELAEPIDWSAGTAFTMRVWSPRPVDVLFKFEGLEQERSAIHSGGGTWEETCVDFVGSTGGSEATGITVIFELGIEGDAGNDPENWTFYFDGIQQTGSCEREPVEYELVFEDQFDSGTRPSSATWNFETGYGPFDDGWGNNEWQLYTGSTENVRLEDGNLVISVQCPEPPCLSRDGSITSARITTLGKFEFRYGRVEARIKPPVGRGAWPAFWALGANFPEIGWPRSGEIDFMEVHTVLSNDRTTHFTLHWCDERRQAPEPCSFPEGWVYNTQFRTGATSLGDAFHIFEAEWDETGIVGKIDGVVYYTKAINPATMEEFQRDFFLILNVAMGGTLGSNNQPPTGAETYPQTMLVDYVRVYRRVE